MTPHHLPVCNTSATLLLVVALCDSAYSGEAGEDLQQLRAGIVRTYAADMEYSSGATGLLLTYTSRFNVSMFGLCFG